MTEAGSDPPRLPWLARRVPHTADRESRRGRGRGCLRESRVFLSLGHHEGCRCPRRGDGMRRDRRRVRRLRGPRVHFSRVRLSLVPPAISWNMPRRWSAWSLSRWRTQKRCANAQDRQRASFRRMYSASARREGTRRGVGRDPDGSRASPAPLTGLSVAGRAVRSPTRFGAPFTHRVGFNWI